MRFYTEKERRYLVQHVGAGRFELPTLAPKALRASQIYLYYLSSALLLMLLFVFLFLMMQL
jgi:hypothetical protein